MQSSTLPNTFAFSRRHFFGIAAGASLAGAAKARGHERIAVIDWAMFETLLALDVVPVAATELVQFRKLAVEPPIPQHVADLGLRGSPNLEMLRLADPDVIVSSNWYTWANARFEQIAPILSYSVYEPGRPPYAPAERITLDLGERLDRSEQASALVRATARDIAQARERIAEKINRPVYLISLGDARHFRVFGADSMYGDVLQRLGLQNAWTRATSYAAAAPLPLEALADVPEAWIVVISPVPADALRTLARSPLWNAFPAIRDGRMAMLPPINPFGALPAARRFSRLLAEALVMTGGVRD